MCVPVIHILSTYNRFPSDKSLWRVRRSIRHGPCPENLTIELEKSKDTRKTMRMAYICDRNFKKGEMVMAVVSRATIIDLPGSLKQGPEHKHLQIPTRRPGAEAGDRYT